MPIASVVYIELPFPCQTLKHHDFLLQIKCVSQLWQLDVFVTPFAKNEMRFKM